MKVGFSTVDITPPLDSRQYVHDPIHVKAAVFENDGVRVALVGSEEL